MTPSITVVRGLALLATALMAGLFFAWDVSVMPGLARLDDRTFVITMQALDAAIYNPVFFLVLLGALGFGVLGAVRGPRRAWVVAAAVLYVIMLGVTAAVHLPLNAVIAGVDAAGPPAELARVRAEVEGLWRVANVARTLLCGGALLCLMQSMRTVHPRGGVRSP